MLASVVVMRLLLLLLAVELARRVDLVLLEAGHFGLTGAQVLLEPLVAGCRRLLGAGCAVAELRLLADAAAAATAAGHLAASPVVLAPGFRL